ncbi:MAG TPA: GAP family protein [Solirubrobacteraceae bacterium]|nr:GAP family protein [Solirubrobacteraceae bacterium]
MGKGISEILTFAVGVAISPVPIIAVILMLFSRQARVNGLVFLLGWVLALAVVSGVVYALAQSSHASTSNSANDTISWGKIGLGVVLLLLALRQWRSRPRGGGEPEMPKWMAGIDALTWPKALGLGLLLAGVNPKNLILTLGAASGLAQLGVSTSSAIVSLIVFVLLASVTIAGPVGYHLLGGEPAKANLDELKGWLGRHNAAVMAVLFLVFGVNLIAKGIPPLT